MVSLNHIKHFTLPQIKYMQLKKKIKTTTAEFGVLYLMHFSQ